MFENSKPMEMGAFANDCGMSRDEVVMATIIPTLVGVMMESKDAKLFCGGVMWNGSFLGRDGKSMELRKFKASIYKKHLTIVVHNCIETVTVTDRDACSEIKALISEYWDYWEELGMTYSIRYPSDF